MGFLCSDVAQRDYIEETVQEASTGLYEGPVIYVSLSFVFMFGREKYDVHVPPQVI